MNSMDNNLFEKTAIDLVRQAVENSGNDTKTYDIYVVWLSKTLQNNKALLATTLPDQNYYEVTANGDKGEIYVDTYAKIKNEKYVM